MRKSILWSYGISEEATVNGIQGYDMNKISESTKVDRFKSEYVPNAIKRIWNQSQVIFETVTSLGLDPSTKWPSPLNWDVIIVSRSISGLGT